MKNKSLLLFGVFLFLSLFIGYVLLKNESSKGIAKSEGSNKRVHKTVLVSEELSMDTSTLEGILIPSVIRTISFDVDGLLEKGDEKLLNGSKFQYNQLLYQINIKRSFDVLSAIKVQLAKNIESILPDIEKKYPSEKKKWIDFLIKMNPSKRLPEFPILNSEDERSFIKNTSIVKEYVKAVRIEAEIEKHFYLAPFDGVVTKIYIKPENEVRSGKKIAEIAKAGSFQAVFKVSELILISFNAGEIVLFNDKNGIQIGEGKFIKKIKQGNERKVLFSFSPLKNNYSNFGDVVFIDHMTPISCFKLPNGAINGNFVNVLVGDQIKQREIKILNKTKDSTFLTGLKNMEEVVLNSPK